MGLYDQILAALYVGLVVIILAVPAAIVFFVIRVAINIATGSDRAHRSDPRVRCWRCGHDLESAIRSDGEVRLGVRMRCPECGARGMVRSSGTVCEKCHYDMTGVPNDGSGVVVCPECGHARRVAGDGIDLRNGRVCRECQYDLSGLSEAGGETTCPECGRINHGR